MLTLDLNLDKEDGVALVIVEEKKEEDQVF